MINVTKEQFYSSVPEESVVLFNLNSDFYYLNDILVGEVSYWADRTDYVMAETVLGIEYK